MEKWKFIEQELRKLNAPYDLIYFSKILNNIHLGQNFDWEKKDFEYFSNLKNKNNYYSLLKAIYITPKCITCKNTNDFYPLKHYDCQNKLLKELNDKCGKYEQTIIKWLESEEEKNRIPHVFSDVLGRPINVGNSIAFSYGYYGFLEIGEVITIREYNITVLTKFKTCDNKHNLTLSKENGIILIDKYI